VVNRNTGFRLQDELAASFWRDDPVLLLAPGNNVTDWGQSPPLPVPSEVVHPAQVVALALGPVLHRRLPIGIEKQVVVRVD
jgi:hypothetical protein